MSVICRTFVQNAWRSDLCSNCFKCIEDHHLQPDGGRRSSGIYEKLATPRYVPQAPSLYQSRGISTSLKWRLNESLYDRVARRDFAAQTTIDCARTTPPTRQQDSNRGILVKGNSAEKKAKSRGSVDFANEEALVIGYGGNDYDSDTSPWEMGSDDGSIDLDLLDDTDEDRKITKLTKNNTEFNSFNKNLLSDSRAARKEEEEKMNAINNNNNNANSAVKIGDRVISNLTYNDIKSEKKLNQYFFGSNCEAIKSFLHGGTVEESVVKNTNAGSNRNENCLSRKNESKTDSKLSLSDNFSPLNTRTYSFISELDKSNVSFEHSSDSDYSTYRNNAGDSTDSESFHDAEESRTATASSFLRGTYSETAPRLNSSDSDKKYEAGSSTSGDVSNFSDDSDVHDAADEIYKSRGELSPSKTEEAAQHEQEGGQRVDKKAESGASKQESQPQEGGPRKSGAHSRAEVPDRTESRERETDGKSNSCGRLAEERSSACSKSEAEAKKSKSNRPPSLNENNEELPAEQKAVTDALPLADCNNSPSGCEEKTPAADEAPDSEGHSDSDRSPDAASNRQSKLAALALELEMARRDSDAKLGKTALPHPPLLPPEIKVRCNATSSSKPSTPSAPADNYPTIKKTSAISSRMSTLPDVLQETPAKQKKAKFSLKKFLKRSKDSATFTPSAKESNPKAWKKQTFDRNRLSLEILHPMDLTSDAPTSADSTPTEDRGKVVSRNPRVTFKGASRARSLSALPQLLGDEQSGCALIECRKMDTVPMRKAGTVAERKKNRPALVRTPSCSALPNRPVVVQKSSSSERAPPPKPPPPPKCKSAHPPPPPPPPPHHLLRSTTPATSSPARPPPPKVLPSSSRIHSSSSSAKELHEQNHSDKQYANLGDIRSFLTPKKPERPSAFSGQTRDSEMSNGSPRQKRGSDDFYETLPPTAEEEDHYSYVDEAEMKASKPTEQKSKPVLKAQLSSEPMPCGRPWLDLETSYAAIAAANYESLAELITTSLNEGAEYFKKAEKSLKWSSFALNNEEPMQLVKDRAVYNAVCKNDIQDRVTLVVASRKTITTQNVRNQTRYPVLATFSDHIPKGFISQDNYVLQDIETASIYVLPQARVTSVSDFVASSTKDHSNQFTHLRNYCFVLLQLIHTLKSLQAEGIEEINYDLEILILVITDEEKPPILVLFPEDKLHLALCDLSHDRKTLCQATLETMYHFLQISSIEELNGCIINGDSLAEPVAETFKMIGKVLMDEKASSLTQAKEFLEYMLWGPVDVKVSQNKIDNTLDTILQRWLDLQRAQMVKSTISYLQIKKDSSTGLHVYEEYQLIFLLQASVKSLKNVISKL